MNFQAQNEKIKVQEYKIIKPIFLSIYLFGYLFAYLVGWDLNSGLCACKTGALPLEPYIQFILLWLF
jgi:hypothetical protein